MCKSLYELKEVIQGNNDPEKLKIAIVLHENPDPDCIASAMGMSKLLRTWTSEIRCTYLYSGEIAHPQNKTFVNVLNIGLTNISELEKETLSEQFGYFITVDVTPERCLPDDIECLMTIDHHRAETKRDKITDIRFDGAITEAAGSSLSVSQTDVDVVTGVREAEATASWNIISGILGGIYNSSSFAKITLISEFFNPEAEFSTITRRTQEWDAVSDWQEYPHDV